MFDIGFLELLVLAIIALVFIGPERLPGVARTVGGTIGKAKRFINGIQHQIDHEIRLDELNKKIQAETKDKIFGNNDDFEKMMDIGGHSESNTPEKSPSSSADDEDAEQSKPKS